MISLSEVVSHDLILAFFTRSLFLILHSMEKSRASYIDGNNISDDNNDENNCSVS